MGCMPVRRALSMADAISSPASFYIQTHSSDNAEEDGGESSAAVHSATVDHDARLLRR